MPSQICGRAPRCARAPYSAYVTCPGCPKDWGLPTHCHAGFARMMHGLTSEAAVPKTVMIDATYLKAHRTTSSLRSKGGPEGQRGARSAEPKGA